MQVQIKKQLKIELDEADIIEAVGAFLQANDVKVSNDDLAKITFVKSPKDGLRASLNVTEDETIEDEPRPNPVVINTRSDVTPEVPETETVEPTVVDEDEEPGDIATSTVEDVVPSVDEIKQLVEQAVTEDEESPVDSRKSLFN